MRTPWLTGMVVLFVAAGALAQQAAPTQPAAHPSTTQPPSAQTGASPAPQPSVPEPTAQASTPTPADDATAPAEGAAAPAEIAAVVVDWAATKPGDAAAGEAKAAACGACHGIDGNSADPMYPKLAGQHEWYVARQLALYKSGERVNAIMQGFAAPLSPQDMRDLGAFFATKVVTPGVANEAPIEAGGDERWVDVGQRLYRGGHAQNGTPACMACHGPTGRGNPGAKYPQVGGQHTDYTKAKLVEFRDGAVWGAGENANAVMAQVAKSLSDQDIEALSTYLEGLHAASAPAAPAAAAAPAAH